jgi:hypothetical protein
VPTEFYLSLSGGRRKIQGFDTPKPEKDLQQVSLNKGNTQIVLRKLRIAFCVIFKLKRSV